MSIIRKTILISLAFFIGYNLFLFFFPLKKTVFYTNEERMEEFLYSDIKEIVIVGSSLSGAFEDTVLFEKQYFNLFLPYTGSLTGLELIRRSGKIPKNILIEINHIDRGIDSNSINGIYGFPINFLRTYLPALRSKNKFFNNISDRFIKPNGKKSNDQRPADILYNELLTQAKFEWKNVEDSLLIQQNLNKAEQIIEYLANKGCKIYLFEIPIESELKNLPRANIQRSFFEKLAIKKGYQFIDNDALNNYETGDGAHLLSSSALKYSKYLSERFNKIY